MIKTQLIHFYSDANIASNNEQHKYQCYSQYDAIKTFYRKKNK